MYKRVIRWFHDILKKSIDETWTLLILLMSPLLGIRVESNVTIGFGTILAGKIILKEGVRIGRYGRIIGNVVVGRYTGINDRIRIHSSKGKVTIGNYCAIGSDVIIHAQEHDYKRVLMSGYVNELLGLNEPVYSGEVKIGNCVWIGDRVIITKGSEIGDGAVVGAGYVVREKVEPFTVVSSKGKKRRFSEKTIEIIKKLEICNKSLGELVNLLRNDENLRRLLSERTS